MSTTNTNTSSSSNAKELVRRYWNAWNAHDIEGAAGLVAEDLKNHAAIQEAQGRAGLRRIATTIFKAIPDATATVEDVVAEGDRIVCRITMRGTHTNALEFKQLQVPATGHEVAFESIHIFRVEGSQIVEHWAARDDMALYRQLGVKMVPAEKVS